MNESNSFDSNENDFVSQECSGCSFSLPSLAASSCTFFFEFNNLWRSSNGCLLNPVQINIR